MSLHRSELSRKRHRESIILCRWVERFAPSKDYFLERASKRFPLREDLEHFYDHLGDTLDVNFDAHDNSAEMLTPLEIEQLRQDKREASAYCQKAFAHLRPKT